MPPASEPSTLRQAYDAWHLAAENPGARADAPWHRLLFRYVDLPRDINGKRVLEIGCGRGELARHFADHGAGPAAYLGADYAAAALGLAVRRARGGPFRWAVADMQRMGLAESSFDTVISCETIEHLEDPVRALREVARVLRRGGRLFLTTPNYLGVTGAYRVYLRATGRRYTEGGQPLCRFTMLPRTLAWIARAGLRVDCCDAAGHYSLWPGRPPVEQSCPGWLDRLAWPFALHSIVVAEKR